MSRGFKFVTIGENQGGEVEVAKSHCEGKERACPLCSHLGEKVKKSVSGNFGVILNAVTSFIETLEANKLLKKRDMWKRNKPNNNMWFKISHFLRALDQGFDQVTGEKEVLRGNQSASQYDGRNICKIVPGRWNTVLSMLSGAPQRGFHKGVHDFELLSNGDCRIYAAAGATGGCSGRCQFGSEVVLRISNRRSQGSSDAESAE